MNCRGREGSITFYYNYEKLFLRSLTFMGFINGCMDKVIEEHPFVQELYTFRKLYQACLFNEWAKQGGLYGVHKSKRHSCGRLCYGGDMFIVAAMLPTGLVSNHYFLEDWDLFRIPETYQSVFPFDGADSKVVGNRVIAFLKSE